MRKKTNIILRIKKEITKGFLRIYFFFETFVLRLYYFRFKKKINTSKSGIIQVKNHDNLRIYKKEYLCNFPIVTSYKYLGVILSEM